MCGPDPEGEVVRHVALRDPTVEPELRRALVRLLVAVTGRDAGDHPLTRVHRRVADRRVFLHRAEQEQHRRLEPQRFLDRFRDEGAVGPERLRERRIGGEAVQQVAEHVRGRQAPRERVHRERADVEVGEPVTVVFRLHHPGEEIVGRIRRLATQPDLGVDDLGELGEATADADAALGLVLLGPRAVQQLLAPVRDLGVLLARDAERFRRHRDREHRAQPDHHVAAAVGDDRREQLLGELTRERLDFERGARRERAVSSRRTRGCSGGSISPRKLSSSGTTTPAPRKPSADENRFASLNVAAVSAYVDV